MDGTALPHGLEALIGSDQGGILWWQMSLRALVVFVFGLLLIRLFGRTAFGKQTPIDILLSIIMGSNLSRTLTGSAPFGPTLAATTILLVCYWALVHLAVRWHWFGWLVKGAPIPLASAGRLDRRRMRRAGISTGDIEEAARRSGLHGLDAVERAVLERSGKISTLRNKGG